MNGLRTLPSTTRSTGRPTAAARGVAQREEFSERGVGVRIERNKKVDVRPRRIEVLRPRRGAEDDKAQDAEAAADVGDFGPALGDQRQDGGLRRFMRKAGAAIVPASFTLEPIRQGVH